MSCANGNVAAHVRDGLCLAERNTAAVQTGMEKGGELGGEWGEGTPSTI